MEGLDIDSMVEVENICDYLNIFSFAFSRGGAHTIDSIAVL